MLGWINLSVQSFITAVYGADKWDQVVAVAGVNTNWVTACPYSDKITYDLVATAADLLGVSVKEAFEAYGIYFVQLVSEQGYTGLLAVLGANVAEFLQNLNNLHLHLQYCWPSMIAPAFLCEQVTPESLLLHYYSNRPGLWPIVAGVLKGIVKDYFQLDLKVELLRSREAGNCDHEVFRLSYPYQDDLRNWGNVSQEAQKSVFSMPAHMFYELHPFHLILDSSMQLLQAGPAIRRVVPDMRMGEHISKHFRCKHPHHVPLEFEQLQHHTNNSFVLEASKSLLVLKGQMLPTFIQLPGSPSEALPTPAVVFMCSPRMRTYQEMQQSGIFFSDIPLHDMSADYLLLAEQRKTDADMMEKFERLSLELKAANDKLARTTAWLEEEKVRAEALLYRMSGLIACFPCGPAEQQAAAASLAECQTQVQEHLGSSVPATRGASCSSRQTTAQDRIEAVRRELARANINTTEQNHIQCLELLGEGTYGKVYKGLWKGSIVAVKTIMLPANMSGQEKREKMAIMEAAISSALSHPNIMQTYTYDIKPIIDNSRADQNLKVIGDKSGTSSGNPPSGGQQGSMSSSDAGVHSFEVRLLCEYCDKGSLREALDLGAFKQADGSLNYAAVLDIACEIATAVLHLHHRNVLHSDLKARNIMLKSSGNGGCGVTAKVADFGLAVKMDHLETHLSNAFQGTLTHMAPEILIKGRISKAADVYALAMVLWELYTGKHVFKGIPRALLGHQITLLNRRPEFPHDTPEDYMKLVMQCWDPSPGNRPRLEVVLERLQSLRASLRCSTPLLSAYDVESHIVRKANASAAASRPGGGRQRRLSWSPNVAALLPATPSRQLPEQQQHLEGVRRSTSARSLEPNVGAGAPVAAGSATPQPLAGWAMPGASVSRLNTNSGNNSGRSVPQASGHGTAGSSAAAARGAAGHAPAAPTAQHDWRYAVQGPPQQQLYGRASQGHSDDGSCSADSRERSVYLEQSESTDGDWRKALRLQGLTLGGPNEQNTIDFGHAQQQQLLQELQGPSKQSELNLLLRQHQQQGAGQPGQNQDSHG